MTSTLREKALAATPGPWHWALNRKNKTCYLHGATNIVMDFWRWGMQRATPVFCKKNPSLLYKAEDFAADIPGREHHSEWCQSIAHPDAEWIAAASPSVILDLLIRLEAAEKDAARYRWLRSEHTVNLGEPFIGRVNLIGAFSRWTEEHADEAIDAALSAGGEKK